ncbi:hypothetical protein OS493_015287 [Desmophyllum pertusum]|uniref:Uncharacterized protein n=1 Tax=Desmophyllum pertusum TaxID=174260 RepID=A0A9X0CZR7_9CNID|nr:hypothetical protein OS493_015287 [Desmophyllum pertusum]
MGDTVAQLEKAKKLYLETLAPGTLRSVIDARQLFVVWFTNAHPGRAVTFPLTEIDIKAFTISLCEAGFKYARIINNIYKGLGMWQISNNHTSPGKMYPELGSTISKYLRRSIGANPLLPKEPMFKSDFEHILDVLGIDNDANLQLSFIHSMSAHCGARLSSLSKPQMASSILKARDEMGLMPYPEQAGMLVGDVKFMWDDALGLSLTVAMTHEKNDAANRAHRREYTFSPLEHGSPYCTATLGFLNLAKRGAFLQDPLIVSMGNQTVCNQGRSQAMATPVCCGHKHTDTYLKTSISKAGFDETIAAIDQALPQGSSSPAPLKMAGGLSPTRLRSSEEREERLRRIPSAYNYRLLPPSTNIASEKEATDLFSAEYKEFLSKDKNLKKALEEEPVNPKKVNNAKQTATSKFCKEKNRRMHEERSAQPPGPPKPETRRTLDVSAI